MGSLVGPSAYDARAYKLPYFPFPNISGKTGKTAIPFHNESKMIQNNFVQIHDVLVKGLT